MKIMERRVVITGMGTINPLGDSLDQFYNNLIAGRSGVKRWESIDLSEVECKVGGDLGDYDCNAGLQRFKEFLPEDHFKRVKRIFRSTTFSAKMATLCALKAFLDAGLFGLEIDPHKTSILAAGHNFNSNYIFENVKLYLEDPEYIHVLSGVEAIDPNIPAILSEVLRIFGATFTIGGACASGNLALRDGYRDIVTGEYERSIIAGAPFDVSPADIQASVIIQAVVVKPEYQKSPEKASRPFDIGRCGFVYSHGAGCLILEELETALTRGASIYGELLGVKAGSNANHLPSSVAENQARIMRDLLKHTGTSPEQVDYINCHATGTPVGDLEEIRAVKMAFGDHANRLKLNAPKSMLGHTCWGSPIVETIGGLLQMKNGVLHPSINIDELEPEIDLDVCADGPVEHRIEYMLKNSFGFGGLNCCSLIKRYEE